MRLRAIVAFALILLPSVAAAQVRVPVVRPRVPPRGTPEPTPEPEPRPVAQQLAVTRSRVSFEAYPLMSLVQAPGFGTTAVGSVSSFSTLGGGTHVDYRLDPFSRFLSVTLDVTTAYFDGPAFLVTGEPGIRIRPPVGESRLHPFFDVRADYMRLDGSYTPPTIGAAAAQQYSYSNGLGGVAGLGLDVSLTRSWSLLTSASAVENRMSVFHTAGSTPADPGRFWMTTYRYSLGVRYNPVRYRNLADNSAP